MFSERASSAFQLTNEQLISSACFVVDDRHPAKSCVCADLSPHAAKAEVVPDAA